MAELVGGAAVGAIFGELLKAVLEMKDKAIVFKQILSNLQSTLEAIAPVIKEMEQHNNDLGRPKEELERLIRQMEDGTKLVSKCSKIHRLNYIARIRYQGQLLELLTYLKFIEMQTQAARDQKETLLTVRRILSKVNKLPYGSSEDTRRSDSDLDVSDSESFYSAVSQLSENTAGFSRTNSTEQFLEDITSLTLTQEDSQLKDWAERQSIGATKNVKSSSFTFFGSNSDFNKVSNVSIDGLNIQATSSELDLTGSNNLSLSNGSSHINNCGVGHNKQSLSDAISINGSKTKDSESRIEHEWVERDEPGVYVTLISLPGGVRDIKRVRFSRKWFNEEQIEQWWIKNRARVYEQYNICMIDKSTIGVGSEHLANPNSNEVGNASITGLNIQPTRPEPDLNGSNNLLLSDGSSHISNCGVGHNKQSLSDTTSIDGSKTKDSESRIEHEWVERDEPGVYVTLISMLGGVRDIKRVRFSRKRFKEEQIKQWWIKNRARVYEQYNIRMIDKSTIDVGSEHLTNLDSNEVSNASIIGLNIQATSPEPNLNGSNNPLLSNGSSHISNCGVGHNKQSLSDATSINGSKSKDGESHITSNGLSKMNLVYILFSSPYQVV